MSQKLIVGFILTCLSILAGCDSFTSKSYISEDEQLKLLNAGNEIVRQSFKALSSELKQALETGGVQNAVGYCHLQASPIIDSLSSVYNAGISRVSEQFRNPNNQPDELDLIVLKAYQQQLEQGKELQPHLEISGENIVYYSPIVIENPLCLLCHGEPGVTIDPQNLDFIQSKYPHDLATGYKLGDLRGVWKITMKSDQ